MKISLDLLQFSFILFVVVFRIIDHLSRSDKLHLCTETNSSNRGIVWTIYPVMQLKLFVAATLSKSSSRSIKNDLTSIINEISSIWSWKYFKYIFPLKRIIQRQDFQKIIGENFQRGNCTYNSTSLDRSFLHSMQKMILS